MLAGDSGRDAVSSEHAWFRFGEWLLALDTDHVPFLAALRELYGDCEVSAGAVEGEPLARCSVRRAEDRPAVLVRFDEPAPADPIGLARSLLNGRHDPLCVEVEAPVAGWRMLRSVDRGRPLVLARGPDAIIDVGEEPTGFLVPYGFLVQYVVSAVQSLQPDVVLLHAGSVGIRGRGILLIGNTGTGKTTLSTALAARGHEFLGDEIAAIHGRRRELLPFRQAVRVRTGPRSRAVEERLAGERLRFVPGEEGRVLARIGELFPSAAARRLPLGAAFVLRGFAERPAVGPFVPRRDDMELLKTLGSAMMVLATWGESPGRRLLKFLSIVDALAQMRCYVLDSGAPDATADLVERIVEESWA